MSRLSSCDFIFLMAEIKVTDLVRTYQRYISVGVEGSATFSEVISSTYILGWNIV